MSRRDVLAFVAPPLADRRRIENEPLALNVAALLDEAAADVPDHIALDFFESGEQLSYRDSRGRVNRLANGMARRGIGRASHVGVMLPNAPALPIAWLALARLGAVMVPMNIAYTPREMEYVIVDGEVDWLMLDGTCLARLAEMSRRPERLIDDHVIVVDGAPHGGLVWDELLTGERDDFAETAAIGLDDLLNIQYTLGTTGFPKGCMLSHRYWLTIAKVNALRDGRIYQRILAATPFFYMDPQWMMLMAFHQWATLLVARRQSASQFMAWVRQQRVNFCLLLEIVFKQPPSAQDRDNAIVRVNVYSLHKENHAALEERFDFVAREVFGMTVIGNAVLHYQLTGAPQEPMGNARADLPLNEVLPCAGDDEWVAVAATMQAQLQALAVATGVRELAAPPLRADALDALRAWTGTRDKRAVMDLLVGQGIAAGAVLKDVFADPHLARAISSRPCNTRSSGKSGIRARASASPARAWARGSPHRCSTARPTRSSRRCSAGAPARSPRCAGAGALAARPPARSCYHEDHLRRR